MGAAGSTRGSRVGEEPMGDVQFAEIEPMCGTNQAGQPGRKGFSRFLTSENSYQHYEL